MSKSLRVSVQAIPNNASVASSSEQYRMYANASNANVHAWRITPKQVVKLYIQKANDKYRIQRVLLFFLTSLKIDKPFEDSPIILNIR